jgi:sugar/nucleoside kinase (ribokinase family)
MKKTEKRDIGSDALNVAAGGTRITSEARGLIMRIGTERARSMVENQLKACGSDSYALITRIGTDAFEAAIAELEK